jgi:hypothetical protein
LESRRAGGEVVYQRCAGGVGEGSGLSTVVTESVRSADVAEEDAEALRVRFAGLQDLDLHPCHPLCGDLDTTARKPPAVLSSRVEGAERRPP